MGQEELRFRCGGARKTFCGQVREHIVMSGMVENTTVGHAVSRGDSHPDMNKLFWLSKDSFLKRLKTVLNNLSLGPALPIMGMYYNP